jgi:hypothetical protein
MMNQNSLEDKVEKGQIASNLRVDLHRTLPRGRENPIGPTQWLHGQMYDSLAEGDQHQQLQAGRLRIEQRSLYIGMPLTYGAKSLSDAE